MNKKIENQYKSKIKLINSYNKFYYDNSSPKVSDEVYDKLKRDILSLERDYDFLTSASSPSKLLAINLQKILVNSLTGAYAFLANAFDEKDLIEPEKNNELFF